MSEEKDLLAGFDIGSNQSKLTRRFIAFQIITWIVFCLLVFFLREARFLYLNRSVNADYLEVATVVIFLSIFLINAIYSPRILNSINPKLPKLNILLKIFIGNFIVIFGFVLFVGIMLSGLIFTELFEPLFYSAIFSLLSSCVSNVYLSAVRREGLLISIGVFVLVLLFVVYQLINA